MTGLDQDMMQTILSCRSQRDAQRGMMQSIAIQIVVITLFLALGALLYIYAERYAIVVDRGDDLFGYIATRSGMPTIAGILFLLGLVASTYSSAGSALTALTTSFTLDILQGAKRDAQSLLRLRRGVHTLIAIAMWLIMLIFNATSSSGVITLIFTMASYTYGPLLGMFAFGLATRRKVRGRYIPIIAILSPAICYVVASNSTVWLWGYSFSYEIIVLNALLSILGLWIISYNDTTYRDRDRII